MRRDGFDRVAFTGGEPTLRSDLLGLLGAALPRLDGAGAAGATHAARTTTPTAWPEADAVLARLQPPVLRTRVFSPVEFGLPRDSRHDARPAFLAAIRAQVNNIIH